MHYGVGQIPSTFKVANFVRKSLQTGITIMPNDEKQVSEGIRRNVIEMNRRLNDISRFVGAITLVGVVACILLVLILWRVW